MVIGPLSLAGSSVGDKRGEKLHRALSCFFFYHGRPWAEGGTVGCAGLFSRNYARRWARTRMLPLRVWEPSKMACRLRSSTWSNVRESLGYFCGWTWALWSNEALQSCKGFTARPGRSEQRLHGLLDARAATCFPKFEDPFCSQVIAFKTFNWSLDTLLLNFFFLILLHLFQILLGCCALVLLLKVNGASLENLG